MFRYLMLNHQQDADPFMHMSSFTNTILAKQCIMSTHKLLEKFTQFTVPKYLFVLKWGSIDKPLTFNNGLYTCTTTHFSY